MSGRRRFLKKLGVLSATVLATGDLLKASPNSSIEIPNPNLLSVDPEKYWQLIKNSFHLDEGFFYFNNGTMGPSPAIVEQAIIEKITKVNSNLRYGGGEECRDSIAKMINAKPNEISITHNTTEGLNIAAWGLPLKKGDEVIMTTHEHVGNAMPWLNRRELHQIVVKTFSPSLNSNKVLEQIESLITKKTKVIAIPHISCTIGQRFPVKQICALAKSKGIFSVIDGAHGAGALQLNMQDIDPDIYVSCGHKWMLGPKGTGFAYIPERMLDVIKPVFAGAYTDNGFDITVNPPTFNGYNKTAHKYDYGTQNSALKIGLQVAADFNLNIGPKQVEDRVLELSEHLYKSVNELDFIEVLSSDQIESRSMMIGIKHKKIPYKQVYSLLSEKSIRVRQVPESGVDCIRISTHIYNSFDQIDYLVEQLKLLK